MCALVEDNGNSVGNSYLKKAASMASLFNIKLVE